MIKITFWYFLAFAVVSTLVLGGVQPALAGTVSCGNVFVSGHDTDDHANGGGNAAEIAAAEAFNQTAFNFTMNAACNPFVKPGADNKFLFVESNIDPASLGGPLNHLGGYDGMLASLPGVDLVRVGADNGLLAALGQLGTTYSGIIISSDFGGVLSQAELDILNSAQGKSDIMSFLGLGGGLIAFAESNEGSVGLTPGGGWFGFLPCGTGFATEGFNDQHTATVTAFGNSLSGMSGAVDGSGNLVTNSHNTFTGTCGLNIVDAVGTGGQNPGIVTLAGNLSRVPEPASLLLFGSGLLGTGFLFRRKRSSK